MQRVFAFGCSFTDYVWPTWADIYVYNLNTKCKYYNYGGVGLGNVAIQTLILEADLQYNFTSKDQIIIGWSGWNRYDYFQEKNNGWERGNGSVLHKYTNQYDDQFLKKYWSYENDIIKNCSAIIQVNQKYKDIIKIQNTLAKFKFPEKKDNYNFSKTADDVYNFFEKHLPNNVKEWNHCLNNINEKYKDHHPSPEQHLKQLEKFDINIDPQTKNFVEEIENFMLTKYEIPIYLKSKKKVLYPDNFYQILKENFPSLYKREKIERLTWNTANTQT